MTLRRLAARVAVVLIPCTVAGCSFLLGTPDGPGAWACHGSEDAELGTWIEVSGASSMAWHGSHGDPITQVPQSPRTQCSRNPEDDVPDGSGTDRGR